MCETIYIVTETRSGYGFDITNVVAAYRTEEAAIDAIDKLADHIRTSSFDCIEIKLYD